MEDKPIKGKDERRNVGLVTIAAASPCEATQFWQEIVCLSVRLSVVPLVCTLVIPRAWRETCRCFYITGSQQVSVPVAREHKAIR
jgi:hypothetical protein